MRGLPENSSFCNSCGAKVGTATPPKPRVESIVIPQRFSDKVLRDKKAELNKRRDEISSYLSEKRLGAVPALECGVRCEMRAEKCEMNNWSDIIAVATCRSRTVGLKSDGTVVAVGDNDCGECDVTNWNDIIAVNASKRITVGLKLDGTVVAVGKNDYGECDVANWRNIIAVATSLYHMVGLKSDGTVVAVGKSDYGECDVTSWNDITTAAIGDGSRTVGLKTDGTVVVAGKCSKYMAEQRRKTKEKWKQQGLCEKCGGKLKGMFTKKCNDHLCGI